MGQEAGNFNGSDEIYVLVFTIGTVELVNVFPVPRFVVELSS